MHTCSYCGQTFLSRNSLFSHLREIDSPCSNRARKDGMSNNSAKNFQRLAVVLAFEGLEYYGFQEQRGYPTIEGCLFSGLVSSYAHIVHSRQYTLVEFQINFVLLIFFVHLLYVSNALYIQIRYENTREMREYFWRDFGIVSKCNNWIDSMHLFVKLTITYRSLQLCRSV